MKDKVIGAVRYALSQNGIKNYGHQFRAGYHTIEIDGEEFKGQRNMDKRFEKIDYDFDGKNVLDLGCNTGGMLFKIADKIKQGVGVDYNSRLINVANLLRYVNGHNHLGFYVFDLIKEPTEQLSNLMVNPIDVCLMLSIAANVTNWREILKWVHKNSETVIYEAHGDLDFIDRQVELLNRLYKEVKQLSAVCDDDNDGMKSRQLFIGYK
jgi:SAM-dependent methyltransferase